jgi:hypothetical protein
LDLRGRKWQEAGEDYIMNFITCTLFQTLFRMIKSRRMTQTGHVYHLGGMRNTYNILVRKPKETMKTWTVCIWFRRGTSGRLL